MQFCLKSYLAEWSNSIIFVGDPRDRKFHDCEDAFGPFEWFNETLPKQFTNVRSLYYRYENQSSYEYSDKSVSLAAHELLFGWAELETNPPAKALTSPSENAGAQCVGPSRPVIFVCQGLGGFVVEEVCGIAPVNMSIIDKV